MEAPDQEPKQGMSVFPQHHVLKDWQRPVYLLCSVGLSPPPSLQSFKAILLSLPKPRLPSHKLFFYLRKPRFPFHMLRCRIHPFLYYLCYFLCLSLVGFLLLKCIPSRKQSPELDLLFTAVSALTSSSMATVEMESFSNGQLLAITILMLVGGEVFTSMLDLLFRTIEIWPEPAGKYFEKAPGKESVAGDVELGVGTANGALSCDFAGNKQPRAVLLVDQSSDTDATPSFPTNTRVSLDGKDSENASAAKCLGLVAMGYFLSLQSLGFLSVLSYLLLFPDAGDVLRSKRIRLPTFSIFMAVSTFANCGFVPTNEGMVAFKNNSGLLLLLSPLVLAGNTLFPPFLRLLLTVLTKFSPGSRARELDRLLSDGGGKAVKYPHLLSAGRSRWLAATVAGFLLLQIALFCGMEWRPGGALDGMQGPYRKAVGAWFQSVNTRHNGESVVDVSSVAPAVLVLYVVMMYLPGYTCIHACDDKSKQSLSRKAGPGKHTGMKVLRKLHLSHIAYISIFVLLICVTERKSMAEDPLNFSVFNILFEVVSAYGNVGFTTGYSCQRRLTPDPACQLSPSYGFVGAWSAQGKLILIVVMLFGRLKRLTMGGGKAWKLG